VTASAHTRWWGGFGLGLLALGTAVARPLPPFRPEQALLRMQQVLLSVNYRGILVFQHNSMLKSIAVEHGVARNGGWERIRTLNGPPRQLLKNGHRLQFLFRGHPVRMMHVLGSYTGLPQNWIGFRKHFRRDLAREYRFIPVPRVGRVAGHMARIIVVRPLDRYRYGYRLWIDSRNGFPLRSDLLNAEGQVIEQMMFVTIHWYPPAAWHLEPPKIPPIPLPNARGAVIPQCEFQRVPPGFRVIENTTTLAPGPVRHVLLSDGLATVSVFIHPLGARFPILTGPARMGPVSAFGRKIGGFSFTVIGEVPLRTVRFIAEQARLVFSQ
jgi:sigma-E factor negative regulatory protein RseB